ncbi:hypothetical protein L1987_28788 [Smallanthus sonchifolius]|uniref:Uncharacterized protein n=1 Tax=Smallanthus sonchifolius TaxID=185202 RepID=A0ACB9HXN8_9ASTR|nr:hypothetical protein L1987_28788 [Smallanthus sonchifolius]
MLPKLLMVLVTSLLLRIHTSRASLAKPGCQEICGNVTILYPFGIGTVGCNILAQFSSRRGLVECESLCNETIPTIGSVSSCNGFNGCCQLSIPANIPQYNFVINYNSNSSCAHAFLAENSSSISFGKPQLQLPMALNWVVASTTCHQANKTGENLCGRNSYCVDSTNGLGYNCHCSQGYRGNPYLPNGCRVTLEIVTGLSAFAAIGGSEAWASGRVSKASYISSSGRGGFHRH